MLTPSGGGIHKFKIKNEELKIFEEIVSLENLFSAWREFSHGKMKKIDVLEFKMNLEENLFQLYRELAGKTWRHSNYISFNVCDPKLRRIHKANVRDRVLHHAVFRILYPIFDKSFIFDSYSCRVGKGTHRAVAQLEKFCRKLSRNNSRNIFALKCDVRKFFDSVDQDILLDFIKRKIEDEDAIWLIERIIGSYSSSAPTPPSASTADTSPRAGEEVERIGLSLGNVTSQLFANIYLNELDQFVKHKLKEKYYLRYCDDFIILGENKRHLENIIFPIGRFIKEKLKLDLHPDKIILRKYRQGFDFLGYVVLPHHRVLRTKTKKRILRKIREKKFLLREELISEKSFDQSLQSYLGILKHCRGYGILKKVRTV